MLSYTSGRALHVISHHYVRDLARTRFPHLKALNVIDFRSQIRRLRAIYEMATVESALAFLDGSYRPTRDLCLLTFDDGLRDHFEEVLPCLVEHRIQGVFFLITSCLDGQLALAHKSHFLMAYLGFDEYQRRLNDRLAAVALDPVAIDSHLVRATYRWDTDEIGRLKYLVNVVLPDQIRERLLSDLFSEALGDETAFARDLYLNWSEASVMQGDGMILGGHTHSHRRLASLLPAEQREDLTTATTLLRQRLRRQDVWPFCYPYGKLDSFDATTVSLLHELAYDCAFTTVPGDNAPGANRFCLRRIDPKEAPVNESSLVTAARDSANGPLG